VKRKEGDGSGLSVNGGEKNFLKETEVPVLIAIKIQGIGTLA